MEYKTITINGKQQRLHRYVMECFLGRKLESSEIVHHIDGNKFNNNIENLEILSRSEHLKKHYNQINANNNQFKPKYNLNRDYILELYQDVNMTHKKLAEMFNCSSGTIFYLLGKNARKKPKCKICGKEARYIKKKLCTKCYLKEYRKNAKSR